MSEYFRRLCLFSARALGDPWVFVANCFLILIWLMSGPFFGFSEEWQLTVNSITTVITYLAVFIIQSTVNRDTKAVQLKLDELIRSSSKARNTLLELQDMSDDQLQELAEEFKRLQKKKGAPASYRSPGRRR